jgi:hypothetical protein
MKYDSIEINGKDYRIEFNWNTIVNFIDADNLTLADLDRLGTMSPRQITNLIWCALKEGCRLEKVEFPFSVEDLGAVLGVETITEILKIYTRQTSTSVVVVKTKKK